MDRKFWINCLLLASASVLAMTVAAAEAGATTFDFTGSTVAWTVPTSGLYDITAYGGEGGSAFGGPTYLVIGGLGATAGGEIDLSAGTMLTVLAGGAGASEPSTGYGGGGGSFVLGGPRHSPRPAAAAAPAAAPASLLSRMATPDWRTPRAGPAAVFLEAPAASVGLAEQPAAAPTFTTVAAAEPVCSAAE